MLDVGLAVRMDVNIRRNTPDGYSDLRGLNAAKKFAEFETVVTVGDKKVIEG